MKYTIYKVTNLVNNKVYIGKHQTKNIDDNYMGSGKLLNRSIKKYGKKNFKKVILHVFDTEEEMNLKEKELVTEEFCSSDSNYNLCPGGHGGWGYINLNDDLRTKGHSKEMYKRISISLSGRIRNDISSRVKKEYQNGRKPSGAFTGEYWKGRTHSKKTREKMSLVDRTGSKNSQYGTMWITNGIENKKIKKDIDTIPEGWYKGRKLNDGVQ